LNKAPNTENLTVVGCGEEGASNPHSYLYFVNNTVVKQPVERHFSSAWATGSPPILMQNSILASRGILTNQRMPGSRTI